MASTRIRDLSNKICWVMCYRSMTKTCAKLAFWKSRVGTYAFWLLLQNMYNVREQNYKLIYYGFSLSNRSLIYYLVRSPFLCIRCFFSIYSMLVYHVKLLNATTFTSPWWKDVNDCWMRYRTVRTYVVYLRKARCHKRRRRGNRDADRRIEGVIKRIK